MKNMHNYTKANDIEDNVFNKLLTYGAYYGYLNIIVGALELGANINFIDKKFNNNTPLILAIQNGHREIAIKLIAEGADVNLAGQFGNTPLHVAIDKGEIEIVKELGYKKVNIRARNIMGHTPLDYIKKTEIRDLFFPPSASNIRPPASWEEVIARSKKNEKHLGQTISHR